MKAKEREEARKEAKVGARGARHASAPADAAVQMLSSLKHPNIVRYVDSFTRKDALFIVMEYADGGDLFARVQAAKK